MAIGMGRGEDYSLNEWWGDEGEILQFAQSYPGKQLLPLSHPPSVFPGISIPDRKGVTQLLFSVSIPCQPSSGYLVTDS